MKGKKKTSHLDQLNKNGSVASFSSSTEEEPASGNKSTPKTDPAKVRSGAGESEMLLQTASEPIVLSRFCSQVCTKLSPELSELVVYCRSVAFRGFEHASKTPSSELSSFSESEALKLIKDSGTTQEITAS